MLRNSQLPPRTALEICLTSAPTMISLLPNLQPFSSTSYRSPRRTLQCPSTRRLPHAVMSCLAGRQDVTTVTQNRYGLSRDGICISLPISVLTVSRQTVGRICVTALRLLARFPPISPAASITTDDSLT